jgi:hypothetical protein
MTDPIRAALDAAGEAARIAACQPECCLEGTGCEVGPCHCSRVGAVAAIAAFLRAYRFHWQSGMGAYLLPDDAAELAAAVEKAADG